MKKIILFLFLCGYLQSLLLAQVTVGVLDTVTPTLTKVENQDLMGSNIRYFDLKPSETCQTCIEACLKDPNCKAYTYTKPGFQAPNGRCYLKSEVPTATTNNNCISGVKTYLKDQSKQDQGTTLSKLENKDIPGNNYKSFDLEPGETCQTCIDACLNDPNCIAYTYTKPGFQAPNGRCYLKSAASKPINDANCISGVKTYSKEQLLNFSDQGEPVMSNLVKQDIPGNNYKSFDLKPGETCQACIEACLNDPNCKAYTAVKPGVQGPNGTCWLKSAVVAPISNSNCISGIKSYTLLPFVNLFPKLPKFDFIYTWSPHEGPAMKGGTNLQGNDYKSFIIPYNQVQLPFICQKACLDDPNCDSWTYVEPGKQGPLAVCWLKNDIPTPLSQDSCISGIRLTPVIKNLKPIPITGATNIEEFKTELAEFDKGWKSVVKTTIGNLNEHYFKFRANEIIQQNQLLNNSAIQLKTPGALPNPMPYPTYSMTMNKGIIMANYKGNPIVNINLNNLHVPSALPEPLPNPGFLMDFSNGAVTATFEGKKIQSVPINAVPSFKLPNITGIHSITTDMVQMDELKKLAANNASLGSFTVLDCHYIIIYGKNLGTVMDTCGVRIEYDIQAIEDFSGKPPVHYAFDLLPYGGAWKNSWFDDFIVALVPPLPGPRDVNKAFSSMVVNKTIKIWRGGSDSYLIEHEVNIKTVDPGIAVVLYSPLDGPLYDKAKFWIYGTGFSTDKNNLEIRIESSQGNWSDIGVISCTENVIEVQAPDFMLDTVAYAKLIIHNKLTPNRDFNFPIQIGPLMTYIWITGQKFKNLQIQEVLDESHIEKSTVTDKYMNFFAVTHHPCCTDWYSSGNDTGDWYFKDFPNDPHQRGLTMPRNFRYNDFIFYSLDKHYSGSCSWEDFFKDMGEQLLNLALDPYGWVSEKLVELFTVWFNPGVGQYLLYVSKLPTIADPSMAIHFNNTCYSKSEYYNLPNKYLIAFQLYGPQKLVSQLEIDEEVFKNANGLIKAK